MNQILKKNCDQYLARLSFLERVSSIGSQETLDAQELYNDFASFITHATQSPSVNESEIIIDVDDKFTHYFNMSHKDGRCTRLKVQNFKAYDDIFQKAFITIERFYELTRRPYSGDRLLASLLPHDSFAKKKLMTAVKFRETKTQFGVAVMNRQSTYFQTHMSHKRKIANSL